METVAPPTTPSHVTEHPRPGLAQPLEAAEVHHLPTGTRAAADVLTARLGSVGFALEWTRRVVRHLEALQ